MAHLDLAQLRTLIAVVDAGSLTAAAPQLFLSQSAVSEQIRKLEDCVGKPLLLRSKTGVLPTAAGIQLLGHARALVGMADHALRDMRGLALQGALKLAVTDYFRPDALARMLKALAAQHPAVRLEVSVLKSSDVEAAYTQGQCDLGVVMATPPFKQRLQKLGPEEALVWACARQWTPQAGQPLPLLVLPQTCALRQYAETRLRQQGVDYVVAHQASGVAGLQSAIAAGLGVACINAATLTQNMALVLPEAGLPSLTRVQFGLLPAHAAESALVQQVRALLQADWVS
ncbi:DNA-binding transcriptional LysR family regulator [Comamonas odontotermitis]|uniref:DNA-binding transcriptional LysR family regulator n=1 Tax=Comamonas odontotermitis TaxID=379895 RepID=A0ABR6RHZ3_9BURK|nr:LysR substrate-binding domain-containing protein [Comamonas odontotermitis]MBB6578767.1 DNA-binding transcriptional LysR family regulator [Comamonas odontotermitis]